MKKRRYSKAHWMKKKETHLRRIMLQIQNRLDTGKSKTIEHACRLISRRVQRKPLLLAKGRPLYSPSFSTIRRHFADWSKGERHAKLHPRYVPGIKKAGDEIVPYLLRKLLEAETSEDAFNEIFQDWDAGLNIPGLGNIQQRVNARESKAFPIDLRNLTGHRFTTEELAEVQAIYKAKREIKRLSAKLLRRVPKRLGLEPIENKEGKSDA
jgi:hypothetical protein